MDGTDTGTAKPDVFAMQRAATTPPGLVIDRLREALGDQLTLFLLDVKDTRTLDRYEETGEVPPLPGRRAQAAYAAALTLMQRYSDPRHIAAWFTWLAEPLDDVSPAAYLRGVSDFEDAERRARAVLSVARQYLAV